MFSLVCRTARSFSLHSRKPTLKLRQPGFSQYYRTKQFPGYRSFHHSLSTSSDDSAVSKSRAPFSMPKQSPNDSMLINTHKSQRKGPADLAWNQLGLWTELADCLQDEMGFHAPTLIQNMAIPNLLLSTDHSDEKNYPSLCFLAATGSGKTLAYTLPLLQLLKQGEVFTDSSDSLPLYERPRKRPRLIVLAPTRELVLQITATVKQLCHVLKLSAVPLYKGKQNYGAQAKALDRPVDIVVATPGRLLQHWQDKNVYLSALQHVVVDEMDTMLEQGFSKELKALLYPVLYHKQADQKFETPELQPKAPRLVLTSATMTRAILKMMGQQDTGAGVTARKNHVKHSDNGGNDNKQMILPPMKVLKADGLHRVVPNLQQVFVDTGNTDKMSLVIDILSSSSSNPSKNNMLTMVFCNTAASCRAVEYALGEAGIKSLPYHGELNSSLRTSNLAAFRQAGQNVSSKQDDSEDDARVLVCTDLAARGLDVPQVDHVVMFDFPLNSLDYLHRSGRTARGYDLQRKGKVTALVSKRDRVLANAIEQAVLKGEPLDGLSSRKSDYLPGGRLHVTGNTKKKGASFKRNGSGASSGDNSDKRGRHRDSFGKRRGSSRQHSRSSR